jgi:hypothetical protein
MSSRRELFTVVAILVLGVWIGCFGYHGWTGAVQRAQYGGNMNLGASLMDYQASFFEKNNRYPAAIGEIDQSQLRFGDGSSSELIDEMVYFCDSAGTRYLAILGRGSRKVELEGESGKTIYSEWGKAANRKAFE